MAEPVGERLARVEEGVNGLRGDMQTVLRRLDDVVPHAEFRRELDEIKSSRRWAVGTFLSVGVAFTSLIVAAFVAFHGGAA